MAVVIDAMAWVPESQMLASDLFLLKRRLTIVPRSTSPYNPLPKPIELYRWHKGCIGVPRDYFMTHMKGRMKGCDEFLIKAAEGGFLRPDLNPIKPRDEQIEFFNEIETYLKSGALGVVANARTGFGKSPLALEIARRLGRQTLILVHKTRLMEQWLNRIAYGEKDQKPFFPNARVGVIQENRCEYKDKDFVVGMVQSLASRDDYPPEMYKAFGTIVVDETHRMASELWGSVVPQFSARYRIGLSATPKRKDCAENVFIYHIGQIKTPKVKEKDDVKPDVFVFPTNYKIAHTTFDPDYMTPHQYLQHIKVNAERNYPIVNEMVVAAQKDRQILCFSNRVEHVMFLKSMFDKIAKQKNLKIGTGQYTGYIIRKVDGKRKNVKLKANELDEALRKQVIFATYKMAEDALDVERLDSVFLTTPPSNAEQSIGRILRKCKQCNTVGCEHKKVPIAVYCFDEIKYSKDRLSYFIKFCRFKKWQVTGIKVDDVRS